MKAVWSTDVGRRSNYRATEFPRVIPNSDAAGIVVDQIGDGVAHLAVEKGDKLGTVIVDCALEVGSTRVVPNL
ncbi:MAG TPA: hypothetical protein VGH62_00525 [Bradyrhizobium sp.]|jgi:hypothetical protein